MSKRILFFILLLAVGGTISSQAQQNIPAIDDYIYSVSERYGIPGVALAIVKDGKILHRKNYGKASIEHQVPISDASIFRVYSLTKPIVTTGLFQLIEQNKLSLDDEVGRYVKDLPQTWKSRKIKHLLTHSSGLPDIWKYQEDPEEIAKEKVFQDTIEFTAGETYRYNQSNYWLIQQVIESITGQKLEDFILENQFSKGEGVFFSTDSRDIIPHRVTAYFPFGKGRIQIEHPTVDRYFASSNGLNIRMDQFLLWDKKFNTDQLIKASSKEKMWELFPYSQSDKKFVYGWDQRTLQGHVSYGFSGSLVTAYRIFPEDNMSIIFLGNGMEYFFDIENIINHLANLVDEDILDLDNHVFEAFCQATQGNDRKELKETFIELKNTPKFQGVNFEQHINSVGYLHLRKNRNEKAIEIFTFNQETFPTSWNTYDSLGEALEKVGNFEQALKNYQKALTLNTQNDLGHNPELKRRIKVLKGMGRGE